MVRLEGVPFEVATDCRIPPQTFYVRTGAVEGFASGVMRTCTESDPCDVHRKEAEMAKAKHTEQEFKDAMRQAANRNRDLADEMAMKYGGVDDPHHPWGTQVFRDYEDFIDRVARPLVEADGDQEAVQAAMALYRKQNPYGICISMVMLKNRIDALEKQIEEADHDH
jgi:hypothetical protein